ncbi:MAG: hypothetical protein ACRDFQ_03905 [Anaerolineales bacterium]
MVGWRGGAIIRALTRLADKGKLVRVAIEGLPRKEFYVRREELPALEATSSRKTALGAPSAHRWIT